MTGDLISREALTDRSEVLYQHTDSGKIIPWSAVRVCAINNAPAVDAVPVVHGRWVRDVEFNTYCSRCKKYIPTVHCHQDYEDYDYDWDEEIEKTDYCPNCGAKMDEEVDSDRGEKSCIVDGTNVTITNEPFVIGGGFVVDVGKKADNALD